MNPDDAERFSYDRVAYPSYVFPQTSPQRLASIAVYHGLSPADPDRCRYLDLGCGDGANTLLHAYNHPESDFVGVDLSESRIEEARAAAHELGLANVTFIAGDVARLDPETAGRFDYIVAHGLYSWVPEPVRESIRKLYRDCLSPNGVGYVSYNTFPGSHLRQIAWGMMRYRVASIDEPKEKVEEAVRFVSAVAQATPIDPLRDILTSEIRTSVERPPELIFHDDLSEFNRPFYFHEFVRDFEEFGIQYLGSVEQHAVSSLLRPPHVDRMAAALGADRIEREQYRDMAMFTRFRSSLICHSHMTVRDTPDIETLRRLRFFSDVKLESSSDGTSRFKVTRGGSIDIRDESLAALLMRLGEAHPRSLSFEELSGSNPANEVDSLSSMLIGMIETGVIHVQLTPPRFVEYVSDLPEAFRFARWQTTKNFDSLTSVAGYNLGIEDPAMIELIKLLDGTRSREALAAELGKLYETTDEDREEFESELRSMIDSRLNELAKAAMLVA